MIFVPVQVPARTIVEWTQDATVSSSQTKPAAPSSEYLLTLRKTSGNPSSLSGEVRAGVYIDLK